MKKQFTLIALSAALAAPAFANGFYVGADMGRTKLEVSDDMIGGHRYDDSWALSGGYQFNDHIAAELSYRSLSKFNQQYGNWGVKHKLSAVEASAVGSFPLSDKFALFGRVGVVHVKAKNSIVDGSTIEVESESKNRGMLGFGVRYSVTQNVGLRSEYIRYAKMDDVAISTLTFGADYRF
ncbi:hypothetical protein GCM10007907_40290 [Chitinimonas prasina]|uniref:Outer membrane protein beta-barrel domain-containing protein n=1 Tax=Chitinimonas prasina TaxID=1434937 RepID=A0ABQ5YQP0_9NEIS|nr:outer membrane beta-barrel protein [Chitinimonas prasina]GLR15239.1 hypothetical protein GCM10007907_40290 [Chitinimonas prasina]